MDEKPGTEPPTVWCNHIKDGLLLALWRRVDSLEERANPHNNLLKK